MKRFYRKICVSLLVVISVAVTGCGKQTRYTAVDTVMGTIVTQTIYGAEDVTGRIKALLADLETKELSWRVVGSAVANINAAAGSGEITAVPEKLNQDLNTLLGISEKSGGAFDITIAPVVRLWNIDSWAAGVNPAEMESETTEKSAEESQNPSALIPTPDEISKALISTGYEQIEKTEDGILLPAGMSIDLGAAGKGIACDRIVEFLAKNKVDGAVVAVGGSVLVYGEKPDHTPWQVAIVDPLDTAKKLGVLSLAGQWCVSTSGDYERFVEVDGVRYHHILNPATGYPAESGVRSVTIVCKSGILSDALSTACFVLGIEDGMKLAESYGAEALFVDDAGNVFLTDGMKQIFVRKK